MRRFEAAVCGLSVILLAAVTARALIEDRSGGWWPSDWPKSLESLRAHAHTIGVMNGTQENIYEITFTDRREFENAWPVLVSLKTVGAPLRLYKVGALPSSGLGETESNASPSVRVYGPPDSVTLSPNGQALKAGPPWPKALYGPKGELPEFVIGQMIGGKLQWVEADALKDDAPHYFHYRARVDIDIIVDGQVIDLNRIALPRDTPIEDHRF